MIYCGRGHPLFHASRPVTADDLQLHDWVWRTYPVPEEQYPLPERRVTASADSIEAATILILSGGISATCPRIMRSHSSSAAVKAVGRTTFSFDVPLHLAMKRSASDKPIVDAFCEDLLRAFNIKAALAA